MQLKNFVVLTLLGGAVAQSAKTLQAITSSFTAIGSALDTLDGAVKSVSDANVATVATEPTADISGAADQLALQDAIQVSTAANALTSKTDGTIGDLIAKKALIAKANQSATVKTQLTNQKAAADALANAIVGKMPALAQSVAKSQSAKISASIDKGIQAFS